MKMNKTIIVSFVLLSIMALLVPIAFAAKPIVQQVTGGGWILNCEGNKCTFGFNAEQLDSLVDGELRGNVEFVDHGTGAPHVHGYEITGLTVTPTTATIDGTCRLNEDDRELSFRVYVEDNAEPGKHDVFEITVFQYYSDGKDYFAGNELGFPLEAGGGGNIQIHVAGYP
jgi:hypothetical protein